MTTCQPADQHVPILTPEQCAALGITVDTATAAAAWARTVAPLTEEQRENLRGLLHPHAGGS